MEESNCAPLKLVRTPNSPFPDYIDFCVASSVSDQIKQVVEPLQSLTHPASIFSFVEKKTIQSDRRHSEKKSFRDVHMCQIVEQQILPLVKTLLESTYPENDYHLTIGDQEFDYIKYESGGYFEKHRDFTRIEAEHHQQYTVIFGLTKNTNSYSSSGHTILWYPVDSTNITDHELLLHPVGDIKHVKSKYRIPFHYTDAQIQDVMTDNTTVNKYLPLFFNTLTFGNVLAFKSSMMHSGEQFRSYGGSDSKELAMITLNVSYLPKPQVRAVDMAPPLIQKPIVLFDKYESWMSEYANTHNLVPFQILLCSGEYNNRKFANKYLRFWNLDADSSTTSNHSLLEAIALNLEDVYKLEKEKLHHRGRESHIDSEIVSSESDMSKLDYMSGAKFNKQTLPSEMVDLIELRVKSFFLNFQFENNAQIIHKEEVLNTWEESGCNDSGDEYDETTYLHCKIDIKFGFAMPLQALEV